MKTPKEFAAEHYDLFHNRDVLARAVAMRDAEHVEQRMLEVVDVARRIRVLGRALADRLRDRAEYELMDSAAERSEMLGRAIGVEEFLREIEKKFTPDGRPEK